ncbi:MAG: MATE family efflux transporter [Oscillospiraceae bacterium]|nr:MATE family efflux transporter [Oscillospiraceae bacterium]
MKAKTSVDMTQGNILRHIIAFTLPLLAGNLFQQLYNMVDTWVLGNFVSNEAFSGVGSVTQIVNTMISLFMGFSAGASVVISQYFGAKDEKNVSRTVHTTIACSLILGVVLSIVGVLLIPLLLRFMQVPSEVYPYSKSYLTIYFSGLLGLVIYNIGSAILRAVGDSTRPFYYLVVCALLNTVLDLLFVLKFGMGVEGVAYATVIAQGLSAVLVLLTLFRSDSCVRLSLKKLRIAGDLLWKIVRIGFPSALQMALTSFSNVFVHRYINFFGTDCISGYSAYHKIDQLIILPMQSVALASTTFMGQNLGYGDVARAKRGVRTSLILAMLTTGVLMIPVMVFAPHTIAFFNNTPGVVKMGTTFLRCLTPFYLICCINQIYIGALRGAGDTKAPMIIMLTSFVAFRQAYLFVMANFIVNEPLPIALAYPMGWVLCSILAAIYYHKTDLSKTRITK